MIPVYQIEILKKEMERIKDDNKQLYNALYNAVNILENHKCKAIERTQIKQNKNDEKGDFHFNQYNGEYKFNEK